VRLRRASMDDMLFLLSLKNEPVVRKASFCQGPVALETHEAWFKGKLESKDSIILVAEEKGERIGQVRFDVGNDGTAEIDISIVPVYRGKGNGSELLKEACAYAFSGAGIEAIVAHIKPENRASVRVFEKAGFEVTGTTEFKGHACIEMIKKFR
jgi:RimJ/RimL family protein N-acetyltransferase